MESFVTSSVDAPQTPSNTTNNMAALPSIKVEEATITPDLLMALAPPSQPGDAPRSSESRAVKKRKSWGQVLPEPKTNLPPRKRAKTADEKEQRRIERVKRNRLAAHNSRERKREEMEQLQLQNDALQEQVRALQAELAALKGGKTTSVPSFDFSQPTAASFSPAATAVTEAPTLSSPDLGNLDSPPADDFSSQPATPVPEAFTPPPQPSAAEEASYVEQTQQSAALLCDLQCRSTTRTSSSRSSGTFQASSSQPPALAMTALLLSWLNMQLFLSNLSTLSSTLSRTPGLALTHPQLFSSPTALTRFAAQTCLTTMLARLRTTSTFSPTQARDLLRVATSLAVSGCPTRSRSSSASSRLSSSDARKARSRRRRRGRALGQDDDDDAAARIRARRERYENSEARRHTSAWVANRSIKLACDSISNPRPRGSTVMTVRALQKLRERGVRR